jgi:hypothetical protein
LARWRDHTRDARHPSYRSTQNVRRFLHAECGAGFKFDRPFMQWIEDGTLKAMGAAPLPDLSRNPG